MNLRKQTNENQDYIKTSKIHIYARAMEIDSNQRTKPFIYLDLSRCQKIVEMFMWWWSSPTMAIVPKEFCAQQHSHDENQYRSRQTIIIQNSEVLRSLMSTEPFPRKLDWNQKFTAQERRPIICRSTGCQVIERRVGYMKAANGGTLNHSFTWMDYDAKYPCCHAQSWW